MSEALSVGSLDQWRSVGLWFSTCFSMLCRFFVKSYSEVLIAEVRHGPPTLGQAKHVHWTKQPTDHERRSIFVLCWWCLLGACVRRPRIFCGCSRWRMDDLSILRTHIRLFHLRTKRRAFFWGRIFSSLAGVRKLLYCSQPNRSRLHLAWHDACEC